MVKMLRPVGNSYGIIIDRPIMALLGIKPDTQLDVSTRDGGLFVRPMAETNDHKSRVRRSVNRMAGVHREGLRELAD
jgi:antitoxin component of MazEF toxin-antitoxin module